jgi:hypothetical protein
MDQTKPESSTRTKMRNATVRAVAVILVSVGVFLGLALSAIAITGDAEATLFNAGLSHLRDEALPTLRCPVLITETESGTVSATFENTLEKPVEFRIRTHISQYIPMWREIDSEIPVEPGARERLEWTVTSDDAVQGNFILVKVLRFRKYPLPALLGSCGILVVNLPYFTGNQISAFVIAASLLGLIGGVGLWVVANRPLSGSALDAARAMGVLAGIVVVGMIASLLGAWMLGAFLLAATLLLVGAIVGHFMNRARRKRS